MGIFKKGGAGGVSIIGGSGYADPDLLGSGKSGVAPGKQRLAADETWTDPLEHFAESWDETYKVSALTAREDPDDAEATVDIALVPKGNGGIQAAVPDGTATGGDARGAQSVDLQMARTSQFQVARGLYGVICGGAENQTATQSHAALVGGRANTANAQYAFTGGGYGNDSTDNYACVVGGLNNTSSADKAAVLGGEGNAASGNHSAISGGLNNNASGTYSVVGGGFDNDATANWSGVFSGRTNVASTTYAAILGGFTNTASGQYSSVLNGEYVVANLYGQNAQGSGRFAASGDAQQSWLTARIQTTDATANVEMFLDGVDDRLVLPNDTTWMFTVRIVARRADANDESAAYELKGCIDRNATAATTALVGSVTKTVIAEDTAAWDVQASADTTNGSLKLDVTGEASKTIRWVASIHLVQVTG